MTTNDNQPPKPLTFTPSNRLVDADRLVLLLRELAKQQDVTREPIPENVDPAVGYAMELSNFGKTLTASAYRSIAQILEMSRVEHEPGEVPPRFVSVPTATRIAVSRQ